MNAQNPTGKSKEYWDAYYDGFDEGKAMGKTISISNQDAYSKGYAEGVKDGAVHQIVYDEAYSKGYTEGQQKAGADYQKGRKHGYDEGYDDAVLKRRRDNR